MSGLPALDNDQGNHTAAPREIYTMTKPAGRTTVFMSPIEYRYNPPASAKAVAEVFRRSGIKRPFEEIGRVQQMTGHANLFVTAWDDRWIGMVRALTDIC